MRASRFCLEIEELVHQVGLDAGIPCQQERHEEFRERRFRAQYSQHFLLLDLVDETQVSA